jgi:hypothetical protein
MMSDDILGEKTKNLNNFNFYSKNILFTITLYMMFPSYRCDIFCLLSQFCPISCFDKFFRLRGEKTDTATTAQKREQSKMLSHIF